MENMEGLTTQELIDRMKASQENFLKWVKEKFEEILLNNKMGEQTELTTQEVIERHEQRILAMEKKWKESLK